MWIKDQPSWAKMPVAFETTSGLAGEKGDLHFVGWLGELLRRDAAAGRPARAMEFWLTTSASGNQAVGKGMVKIADKPVVFLFDLNIDKNLFKQLLDVIADKNLLTEEQKVQVGKIDLFFAPGVPNKATPPTRPSSPV